MVDRSTCGPPKEGPERVHPLHGIRICNGTSSHGSRRTWNGRDLLPQKQDLKRDLLPREQDLERDLAPS
jgi:hypothetical protein